MYGGVECRLPFMDVKLVEYAINLDLSQSPPNKKLLKSASARLLPKWVISRVKDTFQGGSGVSDWTEKNIASPIKFYNNELKKTFGYLPKD
jgi:asparagine synthetase B (glutamine-hydrolysing)